MNFWVQEPRMMGFKGSEVQILSPRPNHAKQLSGLPQEVDRFFVGRRDGGIKKRFISVRFGGSIYPNVVLIYEFKTYQVRPYGTFGHFQGRKCIKHTVRS